MPPPPEELLLLVGESSITGSEQALYGPPEEDLMPEHGKIDPMRFYFLSKTFLSRLRLERLKLSSWSTGC